MTSIKLKNQNHATVSSFHQKLQKIANERQMSRVALAESAQLPYDTVARIMRGERTPNLSTVAELATGLGVTVEELITA